MLDSYSSGTTISDQLSNNEILGLFTTDRPNRTQGPPKYSIKYQYQRHCFILLERIFYYLRTFISDILLKGKRLCPFCMCPIALSVKLLSINIAVTLYIYIDERRKQHGHM